MMQHAPLFIVLLPVSAALLCMLFSRIQKNLNYKNLMTGIYTGNIDAKKIPNSQLSWIGEA